MFSALEPLAAFDLRASAPALEAPPNAAADGGRTGEEYCLRDDCTAAQTASCSLSPSEEAPGPEEANQSADFLGRLHHLKKMFRMSATGDSVSVLIHKVGPLLVLDDGPSLEAMRNHAQPLESRSYEHGESPLMLAALDASIETALRSSPPPPPPPGLPAPPRSELQGRLCVRNTFLDLEDSDHESVGRTHSAPGRVEGDTPRSLHWEQDLGGGASEPSALQRALQRHAETFAGSWSLVPYDPENGGYDLARHWELLQSTSGGTSPPGSALVEAARSLFEDIPPQPSRFGRAVEWSCGPYKILLGCDLVVLRSADQQDLADFASLKLMAPNVVQPSREERLDVFLENTMCDITKVVWGAPKGDAISWRVFNTADLPQSAGGEAERFDPQRVQDHGQQLLHFLRQRCHREGGTYWLFREQNSSRAELFDLSASADPEDEEGNWETSAAFRTTPSLAPPIASLCFHLAKSMPQNADQRQLLQKATHLLEPLKEEQYGLYATAALQLACSYMRTPLAAIADRSTTATEAPPGEPPPAARLSVALRYLEKVLRLLGRLDEDASMLRAALLLQGQVAYAECIVKLVKEAAIPTYSTWLSLVQKSSQELIQKCGATSAAAQKQLSHMKQLSAAFLLWRLFWLCRAHRALSFLAPEKREVECWTLDRDLMEVLGDTLYGLSRYPADDVKSLLSGQMATAEGICNLVATGLRSWGISGGKVAMETKSSEGRRSRRLPSPAASGDEAHSPPFDIGAMYLSKMNPLRRDLGDRALAEDPLVRDDLRPQMWTEGLALQRCLAFYVRAVARLRAKGEAESDPQTLKVARKLAHLYNEEARAALADGQQNEKAEELLQQAQHWMALSGDRSNASRVLLNLSELYARRAEQGTESGEFGEAQYQLFLRCAETCEEASRLSDGTLGLREGGFAHLRLAVHLALRVPTQSSLAGRRETLAELADRHLGKALRLFDEIKDEREVAVCHFHMADLALQEQKAPGATPLSKARLTSALRHARRSAEFWEKSGVRAHVKDFVSSHVRVARLLESQARAGAKFEAVLHLADQERRLLETLGGDSKGMEESLLLSSDGTPLACPAFRTEMGRICQGGIRRGEDINRLKVVYRQVLRNEKISENAS